MGKFVMSLALVTMLASTAFLFAAPAFLKADYAATTRRAGLCLHSSIGCGH